MKKKILWILSLLLIVLVAIGLLLKHDLRQKRTVDGIDISHHNVVRDWNKVKVGFIYAKATEGKSHRDTKFVRFRKNAMKRNIPFGAYHFLSTDVPAKQQFQNFKNAVTKGSTTLIPMLDIEGELPIPDDSLRSLVGDWIQECHDYYGYYPLLYLSPYHLYLRLMGTLILVNVSSGLELLHHIGTSYHSTPLGLFNLKSIKRMVLKVELTVTT